MPEQHTKRKFNVFAYWVITEIEYSKLTQLSEVLKYNFELHIHIIYRPYVHQVHFNLLYTVHFYLFYFFLVRHVETVKTNYPYM